MKNLLKKKGGGGTSKTNPFPTKWICLKDLREETEYTNNWHVFE